VIPHFDKFFKWIPDSAAKMMMQVPDGITLIGIDENTALIKRSDSISWNVSGQGMVRILNSNPEKKYSEGETVLNLPC
jgi:cyanophycinase-like exopeptidase